MRSARADNNRLKRAAGMTLYPWTYESYDWLGRRPGYPHRDRHGGRAGGACVGRNWAVGGSYGSCVAMMRVPEDHPLRRWFAGLVEDNFQQDVGLCDASVLDYLAELLTEFIHVERINTLCDGSGRKVEDVAEMLCEAETGPDATTEQRRRVVHRHIGDYTLFWTGVYPEVLMRRRRRCKRDDLLDYLRQGKRSYAIASELSTPNTQPPARILETLSEHFEYCVYGLGLVRRSWEKCDPSGFAAQSPMWH